MTNLGFLKIGRWQFKSQAEIDSFYELVSALDLPAKQFVETPQFLIFRPTGDADDLHNAAHAMSGLGYNVDVVLGSELSANQSKVPPPVKKRPHESSIEVEMQSAHGPTSGAPEPFEEDVYRRPPKVQAKKAAPVPSESRNGQPPILSGAAKPQSAHSKPALQTSAPEIRAEAATFVPTESRKEPPPIPTIAITSATSNSQPALPTKTAKSRAEAATLVPAESRKGPPPIPTIAITSATSNSQPALPTKTAKSRAEAATLVPAESRKGPPPIPTIAADSKASKMDPALLTTQATKQPHSVSQPPTKITATPRNPIVPQATGALSSVGKAQKSSSRIGRLRHPEASKPNESAEPEVTPPQQSIGHRSERKIQSERPAAISPEQSASQSLPKSDLKNTPPSLIQVPPRSTSGLESFNTPLGYAGDEYVERSTGYHSSNSLTKILAIFLLAGISCLGAYHWWTNNNQSLSVAETTGENNLDSAVDSDEKESATPSDDAMAVTTSQGRLVEEDRKPLNRVPNDAAPVQAQVSVQPQKSQNTNDEMDAVERSLPSPRSNASRGPVQKASSASWFNLSDIPSEVKAKGIQSTIQYTLSISADGRVVGCQASETNSRGLADLFCSKATKRASFEPALNQNGEPVPGLFKSGVRLTVEPARTRSVTNCHVIGSDVLSGC